MDLFPQLNLKERFGSVLAVGALPSRRVFSEGRIRLLRYRRPRGATPVARHPVLIVPSLINRSYVLDLLPGRSFAEYLLQAGFDVYLLEWGRPEDEDRFLSLEDLVAGPLHRALRAIGPAHVVGHCLGGTVAMIYGLSRPSSMASLSLLTAPVDFERCGQLGDWSRFPGFDVEAFVEAYGNVPWALMQSAFHLMRPGATFSKYRKALGRLRDRAFVKNFLALEMWASDNVSFPGGCYRGLIGDLYRRNGLLSGALRVRGKPIRLSEISFPVLNVVAGADHIVPPAATLQARHLGGGKRMLTRWVVEGGHIGAVLGRPARQELWPRMTEWLMQAEGMSRAERPGRAEARAR